MKIIKRVEMTQEEKALCETVATELSTIESNLCDAISCAGIDCNQCPIAKTINLLADCRSRLFYVSHHGTDEGYDGC